MDAARGRPDFAFCRVDAKLDLTTHRRDGRTRRSSTHRCVHYHIRRSTMLRRQGGVLETLRQMQRFLDDNETVFETVNQSAARKRLDETVTRMTAHAVDQIGGRRVSVGETAKQQ